MHSGVDIACPTGSIVIAAADGVVLESKKDGGYGNKILLSHPGINGINTLYAHNSVLYVKEGDKVKRGRSSHFREIRVILRDLTYILKFVIKT